MKITLLTVPKLPVFKNCKPVYHKTCAVPFDTVSFSSQDYDIDTVKKDLDNAIKNNNAKEILEYFGHECEEDDDNLLIIDNYQQPSSKVKFSDLGINEDNLFEKIKQINGDLDLNYTKLTTLGNLLYVGGNVELHSFDSPIKTLNKLETIEGNAVFACSAISDLGELKRIGGHASFENCKNLYSLGKLETIKGRAIFDNCDRLPNLCKLKHIGTDALLMHCDGLKDLGELQSIGGDAYFTELKNLESLHKLKKIDGDAQFTDCDKLNSLGKLETIGEDAIVRGCKSLHTLGNVKTIHGDLILTSPYIVSLGQLKSVGGHASLNCRNLHFLHPLRVVNGCLDITQTQIADLGDLKKVKEMIFYSPERMPLISEDELRQIAEGGIKKCFD